MGRLFPQVGQVMWIKKLADGVLEMDTPIGPRYIQPDFTQRVYLLWIFRNFFSLPQQVLRPWEVRLIDRLWSENKFVPVSTLGAPDKPVIGKIERRVPAHAKLEPIRTVAVRKPMATSNAAVAKPSREAVSA